MKNIIFATGTEGSYPTVQGLVRPSVSRKAVPDANAGQWRGPMHQPSESAPRVEVRQLLRGAAVGIVGGLSASWIMDRFQAVLSAATSDEGGSNDGSEEKPTTVKTADMLSETVTGEPVPKAYEEPAGSAVHYGFGAFLGGLYGVLGELLPGVRTGFGTAYGAGVAIVVDEALVPAAGLTPPPQDVPVRTHALGLVSHLVFGAALEGTRRLIEQVIPGDASDPAR